MASIQPNSKIAIVYVSSSEPDTTEFIANELEYIMVNEGFTIIDRSQLDSIRQEQNFQLSGVVDDETAVSIGKIVGANIIITGSVTGTDSTRRLRLRALDIQTAQVMAVASERLF
jgi:curli biogenesis system outer membrane secretion channel CsgG